MASGRIPKKAGRNRTRWDDDVRKDLKALRVHGGWKQVEWKQVLLCSLVTAGGLSNGVCHVLKMI